MIGVIGQALAACNGGPGLTLDELHTKTGLPRPELRAALARAVFDDGTVTCVVPPFEKGATPEPGRYKLGDPTPLIMLKT